MKPLVLIPSEHVLDPQRNLMINRIFKDYTDALEKCGLDAVIIPYNISDELLDKLCDMANGLLLSGGCDVSPKMYGEKLDGAINLDPERDELEWRMLERFVKSKKPIFGVCRGFQVINAYFGGTLYQDLPKDLGLNHSFTTHTIKCLESSPLRSLFGEEFEVNSYHHQAVKKLGDGLCATAYDGEIVEEIFHTSLPVYGVQFHPERMVGENRITAVGPDMLPLFEEFAKKL